MLASSPNYLSNILTTLHMSPEELAKESRLSLDIVQRVIRGGQASARTRARIIAALNRIRLQQCLSELRAVDVFPEG